MAEMELNFDAPLLSTRKMKKTAVSVRRNMANKLNDDSMKSESLSVSIVQDKGLDQVQESAIDGNLTRLQSSKGKQVEEEESEDDDVFTDARDTLSLKNGISGVVETMKPPMSSKAPQSREFMLNRFLPAAKSMTLEQQQQPQYALKRQSLPIMSEPMRQIRDIVPAENRATPKRYESTTTPYQGLAYEESEEDEDEDEVSEYLSKRGCGMSPQLCFKNSLSSLSSHGFKEKPYSSKTSSYDQVKSSKVAQLKSRFQSVKKLALDSISKQKLGSRPQSPVNPSVGKKFNFGSEQLDSNPSRPSSPYRQTGCMSPYRTVGNISPLHPAGFPGTRKEAEILRANRLNKHIRKSQELVYPKSKCSTRSVMEKTLYVDTENCPKTSNSNVKILPEIVETVSEAVESLTTSSRIKKMETNELEKNKSSCVLSPPPPKKPSDSWLFRNMSSVRAKFPSRRYRFNPQKKDFEENSTNVTKWETIVKTSCMPRDHKRYSEELVVSSCQSKT